MNVPMPYMPPTYRRLGCPGVPPPRVPEPLQWPLPLLLEKFAEYRDQLVQEVADLVRAETGIVTSVNGYTGTVVLAAADVGLGNVVNTGDSDTPVENGTKKLTTGGAYTALARKADKSEMLVTPGTGADADKTTIRLKDGTSATVLVSHQSLASCVTGGSYDSTNKKILLKNGSSILAEIDATAFIKDGMVSGVAIVNVPSDETPTGLSNGDYLKVTFNTDAGADPIYIPLADIFNPANYYTKTTADAKFVAQVSGKGLSTNDYDTTEKGKVASALQPADIDPTLSAQGAAADAKATGDALAGKLSRAEAESGYTRWTITRNGDDVTAEVSQPQFTQYGWYVAQSVRPGDLLVDDYTYDADEEDACLLDWSSYEDIETAAGEAAYRATRKVIKPTKTSQLVNDGDGTSAFARLADIGIPAFSTTATYALGAKVVYDNAVWNCTTAVSTAGAWNASNWTKLFDLDTGAPASGGTKLITNGQAYTALQDKADAADLPYALVEVASGVHDLANRTSSHVTQARNGGVFWTKGGLVLPDGSVTVDDGLVTMEDSGYTLTGYVDGAASAEDIQDGTHVTVGYFPHPGDLDPVVFTPTTVSYNELSDSYSGLADVYWPEGGLTAVGAHYQTDNRGDYLKLSGGGNSDGGFFSVDLEDVEIASAPVVGASYNVRGIVGFAGSIVKSSGIALNPPAPVAGRSRDFYVCADATTAGLALYVASATGPEGTFALSAGRNMLHFAEAEPGALRATRYENLPQPPAPGTSNPEMDGTASAGSSAAFARGDHVHPTDTSRAAADAVVLNPVYGGNGERFGEWGNFVLSGDVSPADFHVQWTDEYNPACWGLFIVQGGEGRVVAPGSTNVDSTNEVFGIGTGTVTATRTENPIVGYTLGDQATKPLQPQGACAPATNIAKTALASDVQTSLGKADTAVQPAALASKADSAALASAYDSTAAYSVGSVVTYDGRRYKCNTAIASGGETWNAAHWTEESVQAAMGGKQDALSSTQLTNIAAVPNKADTSALRYDLPADATAISSASSEVVEGETVTYGAATLADRTANRVAITVAIAELRLTFPAAISGKVRDFGLRVEVGTGSAALTAPALVPPAGVTLENADGAIPALADGAADAKGVTLLYFSETAPGVFLVKGEEVKEA